MNRRITIAVAATAALAVAAGGVATAGAAQTKKKNEIRIVGGEVFKAGKYVKVDVRFTPDIQVKSGATVTVRNKSDLPEPHTISFVKKKYLPTSFDVAVEEQLLTAHQVDPNNQEAPPGALVVDNGVEVPEGGVLQADKGFTPDVAGDSAFIAPDQKTFSFKVTAKTGSKLYYFCGLHPWMQGKISVK